MTESKVNKPSVSVIMPVYNGEDYLDEALSSVLNQTFHDFEFIIIDDGSTDDSIEIIKKYASDERVKFISRENFGLVYTLNEAISLSCGKYIARMDADDICHPERLKKQVEKLNDGFDICGGHYHLISEDGRFIGSRICPINDDEFLLCMTRTVPFAHGSVMFKRDFLMAHNLKYGETEYKQAEDLALWHSFFRLGARFTNVDDFIFSYRLVASSLSKNKGNRNDANALCRIFFKERGDEIKNKIITLDSVNPEIHSAILFSRVYLKFFKKSTVSTCSKVSLPSKLIAILWFVSLFRK